MSENRDIIHKIVTLCREKGFQNNEIYVIGCFAGSDEAEKVCGSTRASYEKCYEIIKSANTFADAIRKIEQMQGIRYENRNQR